MNPLVLNILIIIVVLIGVLGCILWLFPWLVKKGVPLGKFLDSAVDFIVKLGKGLDIANKILPANPILNIISIIDKWASIGVGQAEQLYHAGRLEKEERKQAALEVVYKVLGELNIELTDTIKALIDAAIENAVNALGHSPTPVPLISSSPSVTTP